MNKLRQQLEKLGKDILTEESLNAIENVFNEAVKSKIDSLVEERSQLAITEALKDQEQRHITKLQQVLEAVDNNHTKTLSKVVNTIEEKRTTQLQAVIKKLNGQIVEEAARFKNELIDQIDSFLDLQLESAIPSEDIKRTIQNTKAKNLLKNLRESLQVDVATSTPSIRRAIIDGKRQIELNESQLISLKQQNNKLIAENTQFKREKLISEKTQGFSDEKIEKVREILSDKNLQYIEENFDYVIKLVDKKDQERREILKEQAAKRTSKVDRVTKKQTSVLSESAKPQQKPQSFMSDYIGELSRT